MLYFDSQFFLFSKNLYLIDFNLRECSNPVEHIQMVEYLALVLWCLALVGIITLSTFMSRSRKIICDYFYHRYSKERTLILYNTRLQNRKLFLQERIKDLNKIVDGKTLID